MQCLLAVQFLTNSVKYFANTHVCEDMRESKRRRESEKVRRRESEKERK